MKIVRFVLPFLFVRNWYDGSWEFSKARFFLFSALVILVLTALGVAYMLQSPVVYIKTV